MNATYSILFKTVPYMNITKLFGKSKCFFVNWDHSFPFEKGLYLRTFCGYMKKTADKENSVTRNLFAFFAYFIDSIPNYLP